MSLRSFKIEAVILDLDGVICDTAKYHFLAWKELATEFNYILSEEDNEQLKGVSRADSLNFILAKAQRQLTAVEFDAAMNRKNNHYLKLVSTLQPTNMLPGVELFLTQCKQKKFPIALGSASRNAIMVLEKLQILHFFDAIVDANLVTHGKPHPETFIKAAEMLNKKPEVCAVFEDSLSGIEAAIAGRMLAVGIGTPNQLPNANLHYPNLGEVDFNLFYS